MEQKAFLFTLVPVVAIIIVFGYLNIQQEKSLNPIENQAQCQNILYNGEDRIDVLFISSKAEAEHYTDVMFNEEPYKSYKDYFNIRVTEEEGECEYYKDIAILCNTKQVQNIAKNCQNDYIIVVKEDSKNIRSSAYGNVMSINKAHEDSVLIHEWGHMFNLAEEYGGAKIPRGSENCVSSCANFNGPIDSCEQECSTSSHFRSIKTGVMRSLVTSNYGIYDIALITELLEKNKPQSPTITGNQIQEDSCDSQILQLEIQGEEVSTDNIIQTGCAPDNGLAGALCVGTVCNINTLFTDSQDTSIQEVLEGETYLNPETPLILYIEQNPSSPLVDIILDNQIIETINTMEGGAVACNL